MLDDELNVLPIPKWEDITPIEDDLRAHYEMREVLRIKEIKERISEHETCWRVGQAWAMCRLCMPS